MSQKFLITFLVFFLVLSHRAEALNATVSLKRPNHSLLIDTRGDVATYVPNTNVHLSLKLWGPYFFIQYSFRLPDTHFSTSDVGNKGYQDLRIGLYFGNTLVEALYKKYKGFSSTENGGEPACNSCLERNNLGSDELILQSVTATNENLRIRDIISNANSEVNLAGSWTYHFFLNRLKVRDSGGLVQGQYGSTHSDFDDIIELDLRQLGMGPGFGFTLPIGPIYIGTLMAFGIGVQRNRFITPTSERYIDEFGLNYNLRLNIGTHNDKHNFGIRAYVISNLFDIGEKVNFVSVNYEGRLYYNIQF